MKNFLKVKYEVSKNGWGYAHIYSIWNKHPIASGYAATRKEALQEARGMLYQDLKRLGKSRG